jgi:hypothetical protein
LVAKKVGVGCELFNEFLAFGFSEQQFSVQITVFFDALWIARVTVDPRTLRRTHTTTSHE